MSLKMSKNKTKTQGWFANIVNLRLRKELSKQVL